RVHRFLDFELLNTIYGRTDDEVVEVLIGHLDAVEQIDVVTAALAVDVRKLARLTEGAPACSARWNGDAIGQLRQLQQLSAADRHPRKLCVVDVGVYVRAFCFDHWTCGGCGHQVAHVPDLPPDRQSDLLPSRACQPLLLELPEPRELDGQLTGSDLQCPQEV